MSKQEPKRLGLVQKFRAKADGINPYVRFEFEFKDDRSGPVSVDIRSQLAVQLAKQILDLHDKGEL